MILAFAIGAATGILTACVGVERDWSLLKTMLIASAISVSLVALLNATGVIS